MGRDVSETGPGGGSAGPAATPGRPVPPVGVTWGNPDPALVASASDAQAPQPGSRRTPKTRKAYLRRAAQLLRRCLREVRDGTEREFVEWLPTLKPGWVASTWRQNKGAVAELLERRIGKNQVRLDRETDGAAAARIAAGIAGTRRALERLRSEGSDGCAKGAGNTSASKALGLSEPDRLAIVAEAERMRSRHAADLSDYLLGGSLTGLRPSEWRATAVRHERDGTLALVVPNAKFDAVRAHGPTRTLAFRGLAHGERNAILRWVGRAREAGDAYPKLMAALRDLLYAITRRLWPRRARHPTLYSVRHQFAAVAKLFYDAAEVAALMGHATDETAFGHYGRYRSGKGLPPGIRELVARLPRPHPEEVARIRPRLAASLTKLARLVERNAPLPRFR